ncbi:MAG: segregation and condensation protein [Chthoniobacter sp.]|jgi:segregation and condensation protein B|nr:segregation and condensation protein [Chthoniobacter sp.]
MTLKQVIEALVFASPKPISTGEILAALRAAGAASEDQDARDFAKLKEADVLAALGEVQADLSATQRAFQLVERASGWTLVSDPTCAVWVRQLYPEAKPTRLSGPQLETLAIVAYRQPVTRADIEAVRGVAVDGVMQVLLDRGLVRIAGRAEVPGRPLLYSTTEYFLEHFGLRNTDELPNSSELKRVALPVAKVTESAQSSVLSAQSESVAAETPPGDSAKSSAPEHAESTAPEPAAEAPPTETIEAQPTEH